MKKTDVIMNIFGGIGIIILILDIVLVCNGIETICGFSSLAIEITMGFISMVFIMPYLIYLIDTDARINIKIKH